MDISSCYQPASQAQVFASRGQGQLKQIVYSQQSCLPV